MGGGGEEGDFAPRASLASAGEMVLETFGCTCKDAKSLESSWSWKHLRPRQSNQVGTGNDVRAVRTTEPKKGTLSRHRNCIHRERRWDTAASRGLGHEQNPKIKRKNRNAEFNFQVTKETSEILAPEYFSQVHD